MKNKQMACIVLFLLIAGMAYGVQFLRNRMLTMEDESKAARQDAETAELQRQGTEANLARLRRDSESLRGFYRAWIPELSKITESREGEERISNLIKTGRVFSLSQRFEVLPNKRDSSIPQMMRAQIILEDTYAKTMNWIGLLEQSLPQCRISRCKIARGDSGNDVNVELTIDLPLVTKIPELLP